MPEVPRADGADGTGSEGTECRGAQALGGAAVRYLSVKPAADGPRYKALGNSMAVPVMRWIGRRIQMVEGRT